MTFENLQLELRDFMAILTINRPKKLNALNMETIEELNKAFLRLNNHPEVRVIILTGSGEKAFVAGADISEFAHFNKAQGTELARRGQETLFNVVQNLEVPVIAAVNGFALGGGLELAMASHIRIASSSAKLGQPEVSLGVIPGYGGTQRLAQLVGRGKAFEMILTAGMISAEEAKEWGLVNKVVAPDELMQTCEEIAQRISRNSATAIATAIKAVNANYNKKANGYETEIVLFGSCFGTEDFVEGTTAFLEKRKPNF
jgi:enoyl-CoA hydratase